MSKYDDRCNAFHERTCLLLRKVLEERNYFLKELMETGAHDYAKHSQLTAPDCAAIQALVSGVSDLPIIDRSEFLAQALSKIAYFPICCDPICSEPVGVAMAMQEIALEALKQLPA